MPYSCVGRSSGVFDPSAIRTPRKPHRNSATQQYNAIPRIIQAQSVALSTHEKDGAVVVHVQEGELPPRLLQDDENSVHEVKDLLGNTCKNSRQPWVRTYECVGATNGPTQRVKISQENKEIMEPVALN